MPFTQIGNIIEDYGDDYLFSPIVKALNNKWPDNPEKSFRLRQMLPYFKSDGKRLFYT